MGQPARPSSRPSDGQLAFDWTRSRCATPRSSWSTSRPPAGGPPSPRRDDATTTRSPRSARSRCAAGWCSANWPPSSTPAAPSRPRSSRSPGSPRPWCATRRGSSRCCPSFLEFSRGAVLVAHNAGFDIGFLKAAAKRCQLAWPQPPVLCTVKLARRVLTRDEAPSVRLSALAQLFGATTTPTHRALDDARATVDVLHALIERVGNQGVHTYADLRSYLPDVTPAQRRKRHLAVGLPRTARRVPVPRARRRGALRRHRGRSAAAGRAVLQRRRSAHPDEGDGGAGHPRRPRRVRARPRGGRAGAAAARRARAAVQPAVEVSAPVVVGGAHRRALPPLLGGSGAQARPHRRTVPRPRRRRRDGGAAGPIHRRAHVYRAAGPGGAARTGLRRTRAVAVPGAARRRRRRVRRGPARRGPPDRRRRRRRPVRGARPRRRPCRRWPLRDRGTAARPRRDGHRRAVAWATAACPDRRRRAGGGPAGR